MVPIKALWGFGRHLLMPQQGPHGSMRERQRCIVPAILIAHDGLGCIAHEHAQPFFFCPLGLARWHPTWVSQTVQGLQLARLAQEDAR